MVDVISSVKKTFPNSSLLLYGSRAIGNGKHTSDYDLILVCDETDLRRLSPENIRAVLTPKLFIGEEHIQKLLSSEVDCIMVKGHVGDSEVSIHIYGKKNFCRLIRDRTGRPERMLFVNSPERGKLLDRRFKSYKGLDVFTPFTQIGRGLFLGPGFQRMPNDEVPPYLVHTLIPAKILADGAKISGFLGKNVLGRIALSLMKYNRAFRVDGGKITGVRKRGLKARDFAKMVFLKEGEKLSSANRERLKSAYKAYAKRLQMHIRNRQKTRRK
ncbi:MAG: hypothetical protein HY392_04525 [Candidatus Diapherotrites archaeon]|nr:hypothetical protein [Candidatus Diapherotrites archaeon]